MTFAVEVPDATRSSLSGTTTSSANIGDYIAAGLDLEKVDTDTTSSNSYKFSNATTYTASLLSLTTGGVGSLSTSYANNTLKSLDTSTKSSNAPLVSLATGRVLSSLDKSSDEALTASLLSLATGGTSLNSTTAFHAATTVPLLSVGTGGAGSLESFPAMNTSRGGNTVIVTSTTRITSCRASSTDWRGLVLPDCDTDDLLVSTLR